MQNAEPPIRPCPRRRHHVSLLRQCKHRPAHRPAAALYPSLAASAPRMPSRDPSLCAAACPRPAPSRAPAPSPRMRVWRCAVAVVAQTAAAPLRPPVAQPPPYP